MTMNAYQAAKLIPNAYVVNGHLVLPACLAADDTLVRSMIAAGRAAEVGAEVERREAEKKRCWLARSGGQSFGSCTFDRSG